MGESCFECAFKHLSAAMVAFDEIANGHRDISHVAKLIGHLSHAEEHTVKRWPELATSIRSERRGFWTEKKPPRFEFLLAELCNAADMQFEDPPQTKDES